MDVLYEALAATTPIARERVRRQVLKVRRVLEQMDVVDPDEAVVLLTLAMVNAQLAGVTWQRALQFIVRVYGLPELEVHERVVNPCPVHGPSGPCPTDGSGNTVH